MESKLQSPAVPIFNCGDADALEPEAHELNFGFGFFLPFESIVATFELNGSTNRWNHGGEESGFS